MTHGGYVVDVKGFLEKSRSKNHGPCIKNSKNPWFGCRY